ncbi:MAG: FtsQ-type POTRA domain-containing protein [Egibacteraceae bacterium]
MDARIRARRNQVSRDRSRRRRRMVGSLAAVIVLAAAAAGVARSPLFTIDAVAVVGVADDEQAAIRQAIALGAGDNLLTVDLGAAAARVQALPWVRNADIRRRPPSGVEVTVVPREPVVVVRLPDAAWLVDAEGVVVAGGVREGLVELTAPHSVVPGVGAQVRDAALRNALEAHAQMPEPLRAQVMRYEARSARDLRLHLESGMVVRFGVAEDVDAKARSVALLLEQARAQAARRTPDGQPAPALGVAEIDVRTPDNPVLVPTGG